MNEDYGDAVKQSFCYNDPTIAWNAAIEAAASRARSWGPPNWSASESSLIIKDTCDEIARAILELKK
jgi:hypothetical protein